ncbi:prepilin-type N-terminal cleavage/methylation domain-containing protein [Nostoc sp. FACHB-87]|uniref:type IV pilin-like G/H family protein n=1 Tax=Nostocaceae TaxID=1162 RepID=UPI001682879A|nr:MULTISPECIES: type IV pilin-like G/H family protein [Nostocaceae]MBD2452584.1 prepilin-type N-terminal cleavage/methylation domain-containing protein [Nostoc sp. FACHB-87]MBD2473515.1 prepilin-type N-terminal cleavage/methylation domain-containing protein [Anabaena sp. FACHB-83]
MKPAIKPELQAKFLQHLNNRKNRADEGFTLIELLVVVIIIGVLAAIALPSLLGQVNKAKQSEARNGIGAINRAQQAYFLEYQSFTTELTQLGVGIKTQTDNYKYSSEIKGSGTNIAGIISNKADAIKPALKAYLGIVGTITGNTQTNEALTVAFACEANVPGTAVVSAATGVTSCPTGYKSLGG